MIRPTPFAGASPARARLATSVPARAVLAQSQAVTALLGRLAVSTPVP